MTPIVIEIAWPPSANRIWRNAKHKDTGRAMTVLSKVARRYRKRAVNAVHAYRLENCVQTLRVPLTVDIELYAPYDLQDWDVDNRIKPVLDLMQHGLIVANDKLFRRVAAYDTGERCKGGLAVVTISLWHGKNHS